MNGENVLYRFQLQEEHSLNQDVHTKAFIKIQIHKANWYRYLAFHGETLPLKHASKDNLIDALQ